MVFWDVLHQDHWERTAIMLAKAEDSSFPPLGRRYMLDWVMEQLEMFARIPPCPARIRDQLLTDYDMNPNTPQIWRDFYARAQQLGWQLMRYGI
ncbi:hypothetical protein HDK90DRAFT_508512 [Phyllosticta capitalensis]|uniref:Uncharacterized protein n=1 Tax=Phyllosticta capitalensis TaxID=121624 RepID=A0ABR1YV87_9PEZI